MDENDFVVNWFPLHESRC